MPAVHARLAVEAGASQGWHRYVGDRGDVLGVDRYGASAPGDVVMREYGFTADNVCKRAMALLGYKRIWMFIEHMEINTSTLTPMSISETIIHRVR